MKNLVVRALTGLVFVGVLVGAIWYHPFTFLVLFTGITALSLWELYGLIEHYENATLKRALCSAGGAFLFVATFLYLNGWTGREIFIPYLFFLMYTLIAELYYKAPNPIHNWAFNFFAQVYCAGSFALLNFIAVTPDETGRAAYTPFFVLALFVFIWLNDTGAYLIGSWLGKRRLFERISPKKSWEGFFGGLFFALASSLLFAWFAPETGWFCWLGLAAVVVLFGTWGDLTESLLKRTLGVKDSGHVLPGHGGMLDRFDSVMMAIPAAYIYLEWFIRN